MMAMGGKHRPFGGSWLFATVTVASVLLALPILVVITSPLHSTAPEWDHVVRALLPEHLKGSLLLLFGTLLPALVFAVPSAWLVARTNFPGRSFFRWALVLPLALPTYISAFTYAALLGPTGSVSTRIHALVGVKLDIMNMPGLCLVMAAVLFPYIYLPARAAFVAGMSGQLDAARTLGVGPWMRFRRVALPLARPAIAAGALLVAMETLNDFGAVKYFGERSLTTAIFRSWGGLYDLGSALRIGLVLLGIVALLLWSERRSRGNAAHTTDQVPLQRHRLRGLRSLLATLWCALVLLLGAGIPIAKILLDVFGGSITWSWTEVLPAFGNTLLVAALAAALTLLVAVLFTFRERYGSRAPWSLHLANLGYAIPGAVIAVSSMALAGVVDRSMVLPFALIGSTGLLVYALTVRFLAVGNQPLRAALGQQTRALDDAARLLGASPLRAFVHINLPLLRPALLAAALLVAIDVIKELPLTLILRPFNFHTLSTRTYELASIEQLREASLPALFIVLCGLLPVLLLDRMADGKA